jgi:hypothetical protein
MQKNSEEIVKPLSINFFSYELKTSFRTSEKDFTRSRKLTFSNTLIFMLNFIRKSLVIEIYNFVNSLSKNTTSKLFTSSAYVQARKKQTP